MARKSVSMTSALDLSLFSPPSSFEAGLEELEALVDSMGGESIGLDQLLRDYKRGAQLVKFCRDRLELVRQEVAQVDSDLMGNSLSEGGR